MLKALIKIFCATPFILFLSFKVSASGKWERFNSEESAYQTYENIASLEDLKRIKIFEIDVNFDGFTDRLVSFGNKEGDRLTLNGLLIYEPKEQAFFGWVKDYKRLSENYQILSATPTDKLMTIPFTLDKVVNYNGKKVFLSPENEQIGVISYYYYWFDNVEGHEGIYLYSEKAFSVFYKGREVTSYHEKDPSAEYYSIDSLELKKIFEAARTVEYTVRTIRLP